MSRLGVPVASLPMSVATLQQAPLKVQDQLAIAFSQSGKSPISSIRWPRCAKPARAPSPP